jgi:hypothetical protein
MPLETSTEDDVAGSRRWRQRDDLRLKPINVEKGTRRVSLTTAVVYKNIY